jgi:hypothetical protein
LIFRPSINPLIRISSLVANLDQPFAIRLQRGQGAMNRWPRRYLSIELLADTDRRFPTRQQLPARRASWKLGAVSFIEIVNSLRDRQSPPRALALALLLSSRLRRVRRFLGSAEGAAGQKS